MHNNFSRSYGYSLIVLALVMVLLIYVIRITGPVDLEGWAQHRNVGYVMDMMWQGNWIAQYDIQGRILSKPPLHTWTIAPFAALFGVDRLALTLPSLITTILLTLLIFAVGRSRFGLMAGGMAALAFTLAPLMSKHVALVRSDSLFALLIAAAAFSALSAWEQGRGWWLFWLFAALATITKGPLGLVLAASGLFAVFWERKSDPQTPTLKGNQSLGIFLFVVISLSWFVLAWWHEGQALIDKIIFDELIGHATGAGRDSRFGENIYKPTLYLLLRFFPFSLFFFVGMWKVFRRPSADGVERRFERFLALWIVTGLVIFSLGAHHRPDLLLPLWPACALLAGREMEHLIRKFHPKVFVISLVVLTLTILAGNILNYHVSWGSRAERTDYAMEIRAAAEALRATDLNPDQLLHVDTSVTLQMYLQTFRPWIPLEKIYEMARLSDEGVLVATKAIGLALETDLESEQVFRWPESELHESVLNVLVIRRR